MSAPLRSDEWESVASALAALVRDEYPAGLTLTQIATRWGAGMLSSEQIDAIAHYEELGNEAAHDTESQGAR